MGAGESGVSRFLGLWVSTGCGWCLHAPVCQTPDVRSEYGRGGERLHREKREARKILCPLVIVAKGL